MSPGRGRSHQTPPAASPSWPFSCLLLASAGAGNISGHSASKARWKGVGFGPGKFPGDSKVLTLVLDRESDQGAGPRVRVVCSKVHPASVAWESCSAASEGEYLSASSQGCLCPLLRSIPVAGDGSTTGRAWDRGELRDTAWSVGKLELPGLLHSTPNSKKPENPTWFCCKQLGDKEQSWERGMYLPVSLSV